MKKVTLTKFEQDYLNNYLDKEIYVINKRLERPEYGLYDTAENGLRLLLEKLLELKKKLS